MKRPDLGRPGRRARGALGARSGGDGPAPTGTASSASALAATRAPRAAISSGQPRCGAPALRYNGRIKPGELDIRSRVQGARHTLELRGELDIAGAPMLQAAILRLCGEGATEVVLDLRELEFIDSTGFKAILAAKGLCEGHGCTFSMTRGSEPVQKLFAVSGVLRKLPFV